MNTHTQRDKLIEAICNFDMSTISELMDGEVLHFEVYKSDALEILEDTLKWVTNDLKIKPQAMPWNCDYYHNEEYCGGRNFYVLNEGTGGLLTIRKDEMCKVLHRNPVRFVFGLKNFILDISETKNGKYKMDRCHSLFHTNYYQPIFIGPEKDQLPSYTPDEKYLWLESSFKRVLEPFDSGKIIFWFAEDLHEWVERNQQFIDELYGIWGYARFNRSISFIGSLSSLDTAIKENTNYEEAISDYEKLEDGIIYSGDPYHDKYDDLLDKFYFDTDMLNLANRKDGYFNFTSKYPNLRFSCRGLESMLTFIEKVEIPYSHQREKLCFVDYSIDRKRKRTPEEEEIFYMILGDIERKLGGI